MVTEGHKVAQLSGAMEGPERDRIIDQFRSGEAKVLITTNVLARGIDVQSVTMVINYVSFLSINLADTCMLIAPRTSLPWPMVAKQTQKPIFIELAAPVVLDV